MTCLSLTGITEQSLQPAVSVSHSVCDTSSVDRGDKLGVLSARQAGAGQETRQLQPCEGTESSSAACYCAVSTFHAPSEAAERAARDQGGGRSTHRTTSSVICQEQPERWFQLTVLCVVDPTCRLHISYLNAKSPALNINCKRLNGRGFYSFLNIFLSLYLSLTIIKEIKDKTV